MPNGKKQKNKTKRDMQAKKDHTPSFSAPVISVESNIMNDQKEQIEIDDFTRPEGVKPEEDIAQKLKMLWDEEPDELDDEEKERQEELKRIEEMLAKRREQRKRKKAQKKGVHLGAASTIYSHRVVKTVEKVEKTVDNFSANVEKADKSIERVVDNSVIKEMETGISGMKEEVTDKSSLIPIISVPPEVSVAVDQAVDKIFDGFFTLEKKVLPSLVLAKKQCSKLYHSACGKLDKTVENLIQSAQSKPIMQKVARTYKEQEAKAADVAARAVDLIDRGLNKKLDSATKNTDKLQQKLRQSWGKGMQELAHHKRIAAMCGGSCVAVAVIALLFASHVTAYEYMYNGEKLGVVKDKDDVYKIVDVVEDKLGQTYHTKIEIDKEQDITFKRVFLLGKQAETDTDTDEDVLQRLTYMKDMKAKGYAIVIEGKQVAVLESKDAADEVLDSIKNQYIDQEHKEDYKKVTFIEDVQIKSLDTKLGNLQNHDDVFNYLMTGQEEKKIHVVADGETMSEIAKLYGMKLADLKASNPEIDPAKIYIGQEIALIKATSMVNVHTEEEIAYVESIPYEIQYEDVDTKYEGESTVKEEGLPGEKQITAKIIKENGVEVTKEILEEKTTVQPVAQVVLRGTKKQPELVGTGTLIYPIRGQITSPYGSRWGNFHPALDIAAPSGTPIKAADGGVVVAAGYSGSYGNMVKIDHGGGKVTLYAHCSKLLVNKGDHVTQGDTIANVGSTGNSTGPHVHFEVQINGSTQNPLNYL